MDVKRIVNAVLWGGLFIAAGIMWLLNNLGIVNIDFGDWWPVVFIIIGISIIVDGVLSGTKES